MTTKTFMIEWDDEVPCSMIVAAHVLKTKAQELNKLVLEWADQEVDKYVY